MNQAEEIQKDANQLLSINQPEAGRYYFPIDVPFCSISFTPGEASLHFRYYFFLDNRSFVS